MERFEIIEEVGRGSTGIVYRVYDKELNGYYALKHLRPTVTIDVTDREFHIYTMLKHPGIVEVIETGIFRDQPYILMEYLEGKTLRDVLQDGALPLDKAIEMFVQILDAISFAHSRGIAHRDLKPENIFVLKDGRIKITDFGIARFIDRTVTETGGIIGTPAYLSPEQINGEQGDERSDIFSLGCVFYEMLTGSSPFQRNNVPSTLFAILNEPPPSEPLKRAKIPRVYTGIILKCLLKDRNYRYATCEEIKQDLLNAENIRRISLPMSRRRRQVVRVSSALFLFLMLVLLTLGFASNRPVRVEKISGHEIAVYNILGRRLTKIHTQNSIIPVVLADVTGDRKREIIIGTRYDPFNDAPGGVYCFNGKGKLIWKFIPPQDNIYGSSRGRDIRHILPLRSKGNRRFIIEMSARYWFPYLISEYTPGNTSVEAYFWNAGWVLERKLVDVDGDGVKDIVLAGVNNQLGFKPVVFALSGKGFRGQSPLWTGRTQIEEYGLIFYTVLPGSGKPFGLSIKDRTIEVETNTGLTNLDFKGNILGEKGFDASYALRNLDMRKHLWNLLKQAFSTDGENGIKIVQSTLNEEFPDRYMKSTFYYLLGFLKERNGDIQGAVEAYNRALELDARYGKVHSELARIYGMKGDYGRAEELAKKAYTITSDQWDFYFLQLLHLLQGRWIEAKENMDKFNYANTDFAMAVRGIIEYFGCNVERAESLFTVSLKGYPDFFLPLLWKAIVCSDRGDRNGYRNLAERFPSGTITGDMEGVLLIREGKYKQGNKILLGAMDSLMKEWSIYNQLRIERIKSYMEGRNGLCD